MGSNLWVNIDPATLSRLHYHGSAGRLPEVSCIYFLLEAGSVVYVGQSINLRRRHFSHHRRIEFLERGSEICWIDVPEQYLDEAERYFISKLNPCMNGNTGNPEHSESSDLEGVLADYYGGESAIAERYYEQLDNDIQEIRSWYSRDGYFRSLA
jgi:hypothetical protein